MKTLTVNVSLRDTIDAQERIRDTRNILENMVQTASNEWEVEFTQDEVEAELPEELITNLKDILEGLEVEFTII